VVRGDERLDAFGALVGARRPLPMFQPDAGSMARLLLGPFRPASSPGGIRHAASHR
jgi:hypothetical protein